MRQRYDVAVVGAGPAGAVLATLVAQAGMRVVVIDAATFPRQKVCGEYLGAGAWPTLEESGGADTVRIVATPVRRVSLVLPRAGDLSAAISAPGPSGPVSVSRYRLDHLLVERAAAAGAEVVLGHRAREVIVERGRVCGVTASSVCADKQSLTIQAGALIAADGRLSHVVQQTGRLKRRGPRLVGFKQHFAADAAGSPAAETLEMHSLPAGYVGVCRVEQDRINVCGVLPRRQMQAARGNFPQALAAWAALQPRLARLIDGDPEQGWKTVADVSTQRARPRLPGVLYIGDACGTIEPLTGHGMTMAIQSAALASRILLSGDGAMLPASVQAAYDAAWDTQFAPTIRRASALGWLLRRPRLIETLTLINWLKAELAGQIFGGLYRRLADGGPALLASK